MKTHLDLNQAQEIAVFSSLSPILVLAGAGSGKTRVVAFRVVHLLQVGLSPEEIVVVTFTNKAAKEIEERILSLTNKISSSKPLICTFHSLGVHILRRSINHLGFSLNFSIYDQNDSLKVIKHVLKELNIKPSFSEAFQKIISQAKGRILLPKDKHHDFFQSYPDIIEVYTVYQNKLKEANALDFDDLLLLTVELFKSHPEVAEEYQTLWKALLIDEYQDTNFAQYLIAKEIVKKHFNIFAVGDPDQSIYSWRGANVNNILNFEKDYPKAQIIKLEENHRSYSNILNAANALISHNFSRYKKNLISTKGAGEKIKVFYGLTERDEADFVAREIEKLLYQRKFPLKNICVFYRTNFQSRAFEDAFLKKNIPYTIIGGISFYQRKEIKDILAYLRMIIAEKDFISFERSLNIPKRGIGPATMTALYDFSIKNNLSLIDACEQFILFPPNDGKKLSKPQKEKLQQYVTLIKTLKINSNVKELHSLVIETIQNSNYLNYLKEDEMSYEERKENLDALVSKTYEWTITSEQPTLDKFLEELALKNAHDETSSKERSLKLMTIHNSKGLEFPVAFITGLEENLFPHANAKENFESIEEERRLCYVGITRAKELLYLTGAQTRFIWGTLKTMRPSRFLKEIPEEFLFKVR